MIKLKPGHYVNASGLSNDEIQEVERLFLAACPIGFRKKIFKRRDDEGILIWETGDEGLVWAYESGAEDERFIRVDAKDLICPIKMALMGTYIDCSEMEDGERAYVEFLYRRAGASFKKSKYFPTNRGESYLRWDNDEDTLVWSERPLTYLKKITFNELSATFEEPNDNFVYIVLRNSDFTEGRGHMYVHAVFANEDDAVNFINDQTGIMGCEPGPDGWPKNSAHWRIEKETVINSYEPAKTKEERLAEEREKALSKLTDYDKKILGLLTE